MYVRITRRPDGEAPEWVRDAWIGLRLPVLHPKPQEFKSTGVLSAGKNPLATFFARLQRRTFIVRGYVVHGPSAVAVLAASNPRAAEWWRTNCPRIVTGQGSGLIFKEHECQRENEEPCNDR